MVPYHEESDRYELEIWSYPGADLRDQLDAKGRQSLDRQELLNRPDLLRGTMEDLRRENVEDKPMPSLSPGHLMHPVNTLRITMAWADMGKTLWDSRDGKNYVYEFIHGRHRDGDHQLEPPVFFLLPHWSAASGTLVCEAQ